MKVRNKRIAVSLLACTLIMGINAAPAAAAQDSLLSDVSLATAAAEEEESTGLAAVVEEEIEAEEAAQAAEEAAYANIGVAVVDDYVNIRSTSSTDGEIVGIIENNAVATIEGEQDGWYQISSGEISGYVRADFLVVGDVDLVKSVQKRVAQVTADSLNIRSEASTDSSLLAQAAQGEYLEVTDESVDGWVKVATSDGEGYVSSDYVSVSDSYTYAKEPSAIETAGESVVNYALQFVGNPYVWGGTSLTNGADCSGFIMSVYAAFGVSLPHSSYALRSVGTAVSYSEAQPGDIICYNGHVALYMGNGQIVHASNKKDGIKISGNAAYREIVAVRRIFN